MAEKELEDVFNIDPLNLQGAFCELPGDLAYWSGQYATAHRAAAAAKANEKQVVGAMREVARERVIALRGKSTDKDVEAMIELVDEVQEAREQAIEAEYEKTRLFGVVDSIRSKRDMLISVGAHVRAEMEHDPVIKSGAAGHSWGRKQ